MGEYDLVPWEEYIGRTIKVMRPNSGRIISVEVQGAGESYVKLRVDGQNVAYFNRNTYIMAPAVAAVSGWEEGK